MPIWQALVTPSHAVRDLLPTTVMEKETAFGIQRGQSKIDVVIIYRLVFPDARICLVPISFRKHWKE